MTCPKFAKEKSLRRMGDERGIASFSEVILNKETPGILQISLNNCIVFMYSF